MQAFSSSADWQNALSIPYVAEVWGSRDKHAWDMVPRAGGRGWYQLSLLDCKRLMGFPEDYKMPVARTHQFRLLGNAVPTQPAALILRECKRIVHELFAQRMFKRARRDHLT